MYLQCMENAKWNDMEDIIISNDFCIMKPIADSIEIEQEFLPTNLNHHNYKSRPSQGIFKGREYWSRECL